MREIDEIVRILKAAIEQGGNFSIRVIKTTRWQRQKGEELLDLITGKKRYEERASFPSPPMMSREIARWDEGKYDINKWG